MKGTSRGLWCFWPKARSCKSEWWAWC